MPNGYSVNASRRKFRCAIIVHQLFDVMSDADSRLSLEDLLVKKYLTYDSPLDRGKIIAAIGMSLLLVA